MNEYEFEDVVVEVRCYFEGFFCIIDNMLFIISGFMMSGLCWLRISFEVLLINVVFDFIDYY